MNVLSRAARPAWLFAFLSLANLTTTHVVAALGVLFLVTHLGLMAPGPGSVDAMNFAMGVQDFNVSEHRPHPPGYPVFVALGKITRPLIASSAPHADTVRDEARALAIWSAVFGAVAVFALFSVFRNIDQNDRRAAAATALTVTCPLFWFLAMRPMSDVPGFGSALIAQAILFSAYRHQVQRQWWQAMRATLGAAFISGLAIGLRSQTMWLTVPLLTIIAFRQIRTAERPLRCLASLTLIFTSGVVLWAVPLMIASGGVYSYQAALAAQAGEDFADVQMLVDNPSVSRLITGLVSTFAYPWANKFLAAVVLSLSAIGVIGLARRSAWILGWLVLATGPYTVFHLLFQDPDFTRYALPATPFVAYTAICGLDLVGPRVLSWVTIGLALGGLIIGGQPALAYAAAGSAAYQAIAGVRQALSVESDVRPIIAAHLEVDRAIRGEHFDAPRLPSTRRHEWMEVINYWRGGGAAPVWFLADSGRTDLALIDRWAQTVRATFRRPFTNRFLMSGARPGGVNWIELRDPGWMVGEGWALTPETAGVAWRDMRGPGYAPISAWVRRRPEAAVMIIGGRNHGTARDPDVRFDATLDGRPLDSWVVGPDPGFFLRTLRLPAGSLTGAGRYAELHVSARSADGVIRQVGASLEQFDVQSADRPVYGFDTGWYQLEYDSTAQRFWRWMGPWARLRVHDSGEPLVLRLTGPSPLEYLEKTPNITVRAGDRVLGRLAPNSDFSMEVMVPPDVLRNTDGVVTVETDLTFVPDDRLHNGDRRPLGLRIFEAAISQ